MSAKLASGLVRPYLPDDPGTHPLNDTPAYGSSARRAPRQPKIPLIQTAIEVTGPLFFGGRLGEHDHDLTRQRAGEPLGERIIVHGSLSDGDDRPIAHSLIELWQANAAGRYAHPGDVHDAPLDPNFGGTGRVLTDAAGRFTFTTIKPGAYPWKNHANAWRPAHIHFSLFGTAFAQRLVTQMYFPADPLLPLDPIFNAVPDARARERLVARFDSERTVPEWALAYSFDIVLRGRAATPFEGRP